MVGEIERWLLNFKRKQKIRCYIQRMINYNYTD